MIRTCSQEIDSSGTTTHPLNGDEAPTHDARVLSAAVAEHARLIRPGDPVGQNMVDYALEIVALTARIADRYACTACEEDTVGEAIRGNLFSIKPYQIRPASRIGLFERNKFSHSYF